MEGILDFFQSGLGQIILLVVVALFAGKNPGMIDWVLELLKIQKPKTSIEKAAEEKIDLSSRDEPKILKVEGEEIDDNEPTRAEAFVAANVLIEYFSEQGEECKEGIVAAKKAGQCLFH